jgi:hypothetical protein
MRKKLFWSFVAATTILAGCNNDEILDSQAPVTLSGEEVPVDFSIDLGGGISTYSTESSKGGWSNYKDDADMQNQYNHRAIIQVFAQSGADALPISEARRVIDKTPDSDVIDIANLRLPAGHTYTAVVWVDFVAEATTESTTAERNDLFYDTKNLRNVTMIEEERNPAGEELLTSPEGRDAYTGKITFTVNADGTYDTGAGETEKTTAINITAKRPFGKVRLVLTDWNNKAQWEQYYAGQFKVMDLITMKVGGNMARAFNALEGAPIYTGTEGDFTFVRPWSQTADANNNVDWIEIKDGKEVANPDPAREVTGIADGFYPVLDFNYFIPISLDDAASYKMSINTYDDSEIPGVQWQLISTRTFASIPVKTNCLTTIWGNFLTAGYDFQVTVNDEFDQFSQTVVTDEGPSTDIVHYWGNATARVERDANGDVTFIEIDADGKTVQFDEAQWAKIIYEIKHLSGSIDKANVLIHAGSLPATTDFESLVVGAVELQLEGVLAADTQIINSASSLTITNEADQTEAIAVSATNDVVIAGAEDYANVNVGTSGDATFTATGAVGNVVAAANNISFSGIGAVYGTVNAIAVNAIDFEVSATYNGAISAEAPSIAYSGEASSYNGIVTTKGSSTFNGGQFNDVVNALGTAAVINGGRFEKNFNSMVDTTVNGGSLNMAQASGTLNYLYALSMNNTISTTLTIAKTGSAFGPIYAVTPQYLHKLVYTTSDISDYYQGFNTGNFDVTIKP